MSLAFLLVDMQPYYLSDVETDDLFSLLNAQQSVFSYVHRRNIPVFAIETQLGDPSVFSVFGSSKSIDNVSFFYKCSSSAFTDASFVDSLEHQNISSLIVSGVYASGCVVSTVIDALEAGFSVYSSLNLIADADGSLYGSPRPSTISWFTEHTHFFDRHTDLLFALQHRLP